MLTTLLLGFGRFDLCVHSVIWLFARHGAATRAPPQSRDVVARECTFVCILAPPSRCSEPAHDGLQDARSAARVVPRLQNKQAPHPRRARVRAHYQPAGRVACLAAAQELSVQRDQCALHAGLVGAAVLQRLYRVCRWLHRRVNVRVLPQLAGVVCGRSGLVSARRAYACAVSPAPVLNKTHDAPCE